MRTVIEVLLPIFSYEIGNPYNVNPVGDKPTRVVSVDEFSEFPEYKDSDGEEILYKYTDNRGYILKLDKNKIYGDSTALLNSPPTDANGYPLPIGGFSVESIMSGSGRTYPIGELSDKNELTFGEILVGLSFNPSGNDIVNKAKLLCAELADLVNDHYLTWYAEHKDDTNPTSQIKGHLYDHTLGELLNAQMNIVKLITFNNKNMETIRAKFYINEVANIQTQQPTDVLQRVQGAPVTYGKTEENKSFSLWTPSGKLELSITNPAAIDFFKPGKEYYLDITEATA